MAGNQVAIKLSVTGVAQSVEGVKSVGGALEGLSAGTERIGNLVGKLGGAFSALAGLSFAGIGVRQLSEMADVFTSLNARLTLATGSVAAASVKFEQLREIANKTQQPLADISQVYLGIQRAAGDLGASQNQLIKFTDGVATSLRLSGTSGAAASGALSQLSQMMGGASVQAQEFNSLVDGAPVLLRAVAANLGKTGISMGELRERVLAGKLSTKDFFEAFLKGTDDLKKSADAMPNTIGGAFTVLKNNAIALTGQLDSQFGVTQKLSTAILALAGNMRQVVAVLEIAALVAFAYWKQAVVIPAITALWTTAKTALTAALVRFQLAAAISGSATATLTAGLQAATVGTLTLTGATSKLAAGFGALAALFIGWEIGTILRENFVEAQLAGVAFVAGTLKGWEALTYGAKVAWAYIGSAWRSTVAGMGSMLTAFLSGWAKGLASLGFDQASAKLLEWSDNTRAATADNGDLQAELARLGREYTSNTAKITTITDEMADEAIASFAVKKAHASVGDEIAAVTTKRGANAAAVKVAAKAASDEIKLLNEMAGINQDYLADLGLLDAARKKKNLTEERYIELVTQLINKQPMVKAMHDEQSKAAKDLAADIEELWKWRLKEADEAQKRADSINDQVSKQLAENESLRYTRGELAQLAAQRLDDEIRIASANVTRDESLASCTRETEAHKATLQALLDLKSARDEGVILAAANEASTAWQKTAEEVGQGLTDSLFRAFEAGKGFFDTLWSGIKNLFKTTVLKLAIQPVQSGINGMVGSALGMGGTAANAANGSSPLSSAMSILAMGKSAFSAGASLTGFTGAGTGMALKGAGSMMANGSIVQGASQGLGALAPWAAGAAVGVYGGRAISNGYSAVGSSGNTLVNAGTIAGALLGGPIGAAIGGAIGGLVNRAFGKGPRQNRDAGIEGSIGGGGVTGQAFQDWFVKGGTFRSDDAGTDRKALSSEIDALLDGGAKAVLDQTKMWATTLGLSTDALASVTSKFRVKLTGDAAADEKAISDLMQTYQTALTQKLSGAVSSLRRSGESVADALARLSALAQFSEELKTFGGVFSRIASASIGARENLIGLAGGIEALAAKSAQFVSDYYTQDEQAGLQAVAVRDALRAIGIDGSSLNSRADFRALVDSMGADIENATAQQQLIGLLNIAPEFAKLGDYLSEQGKTLQQAADAAPQVAVLEQVISQSAMAQKQVDNTKATADGVTALRSDVAALREDTRTGLASVALYSSKMAKLFDSWDNGGRMNVSLP